MLMNEMSETNSLCINAFQKYIQIQIKMPHKYKIMLEIAN